MTQPYRLVGVHQGRVTRGFTLVELLIVVAIAGILAALAYPSYTSQIRKSRRSDAVSALSKVQQAQERYRSNHTQYAAAPSELGLTASTDNQYYTLTIVDSTTSGYTVTASAVTGKSQTGDSGCTDMKASVTGGSATYLPAQCWSK